PKALPANPGICRYIWEHFQDVNRCVQHVGFTGGTFSGPKSLIGPSEFMTIGHFCTEAGHRPDAKRLKAVVNW
ncbi:hypothetical protein L227DRAFT_480004, partial [Lentinus tigrinus ALCF2SS1-6]